MVKLQSGKQTKRSNKEVSNMKYLLKKNLIFILILIITINFILPTSIVFADTVSVSASDGSVLELQPIEWKAGEEAIVGFKAMDENASDWKTLDQNVPLYAVSLHFTGETATYHIPALVNYGLNISIFKYKADTKQLITLGNITLSELQAADPNFQGNAAEYRVLENGETYIFEVIGMNPNSSMDLNATFFSKNTQQPSQVIEDPDKRTGLFDTIEKLISYCINGVAGGINALIGAGMGQVVTIDNIIFNEFDQTRLDFFVDKTNGPVVRAGIIESLEVVINTWFGHFRDIALVGYLLILIYVGIKIMLGSTGKQMSAYKELFMNWVVGVAILLLFPFVMKYTIMINNTLVKMVADARPLVFRNATVQPSPSSKVTTDITTLDFSNIDYSGRTDYMSVMGKNAQEKLRLSYSIVYLIMVCQLIAIILLYYKRLFMIGFLIVLFPLVALSYVIDKIGDGKSQALNTWVNEFMINVFVQAFHAVIYVFALGVVFRSGNQNDWILMLIGVTFLFKGEEIIKKIFGQTSSAGTMTSLADSLTTTMAAVAITRRVAKNISDNFVGQKSHLGRMISGIRERNMYRNMERNFDTYAVQPEEDAPANIFLPHMPNNPTEDERELGNNINTLNNLSQSSPEEIARALAGVQDAREKGRSEKEMLKDLDMSDDQLEALDKVKGKFNEMTAQGKKAKEINQSIKMEIERIVGSKDAKYIHAGLMTQIAHKGTTKKRAVDRATVESDVDELFEKTEKIRESVNVRLKERAEIGKTVTSGSGRGTRIGGGVTRVSARADLPERNRRVTDGTNQILRDVTGSDKNVTDVQKNMARSVSMLLEGKHGTFAANELNKAADYVEKHKDADNSTRKIASKLGADIGEYRHALAIKVNENDNDISINIDDRSTGSERKEKEQEEKIALEKDSVEQIEKYESEANRPKYETEEITVHELLRTKKSRANSDEVVKDLISRRRKQNQKEITETIDMAREILQEESDNGGAIEYNGANPNAAFSVEFKGRSTDNTEAEPMLNGMTLDDIRNARKLAGEKITKNLIKTASTMTAASVGGVLGGLTGTVFNEEKTNALEGAFSGAVVGMGLGDAIAEKGGKWSDLSDGLIPVLEEKESVEKIKKKVEKQRGNIEKEVEDNYRAITKRRISEEYEKGFREGKGDIEKQIRDRIKNGGGRINLK
jgi:hypothetical protein